MTSPRRTPTEVLVEARKRSSARKRAHVKATVDEMTKSGTPVTFAAVARAAGVSMWLVYADGVRDYIEHARATQADTGAVDEALGRSTSKAGVLADLEHIRQDNRRLRTENTNLKRAVHESLGRQLDDESNHHLRARIDDLTAANAKLQHENERRDCECRELREALRISEDDLTAARTSLRRMIKDCTDQLSDSPTS